MTGRGPSTRPWAAWPQILAGLAASVALHIGVAAAVVMVWGGSAEPDARGGRTTTVSLTRGVDGGGPGVQAAGAPAAADSPAPARAASADAPTRASAAPGETVQPADTAPAERAAPTRAQAAEPVAPAAPDSATAPDTPAAPHVAAASEPDAAPAAAATPAPSRAHAPRVASAQTAAPAQRTTAVRQTPPRPSPKPAAPPRVEREAPPKPTAKPAPTQAPESRGENRARRARASGNPAQRVAGGGPGDAEPPATESDPAKPAKAADDTSAQAGPETAKAAGKGAGDPDAAREGAGGGGHSARPVAPEAGNPPPGYPRVARRRGWEGRVVLAVTVSAEGDVAALSVAESSGHALLDRAAKRAVRDWHFRPAERLGEPVRDRIRVPITFRLTRG